MAKDKSEKGKSKSKGKDYDDYDGRRGGKDKGDKGSRKGKGKGKDRHGAEWDEHEGEDDTTMRSNLSSHAPDFTPGAFGMYNDVMQQPWADWPVAATTLPLWREYKDEDGIPYYHNAKTGLCQWEKPAELEPKLPQQEKEADREPRSASGFRRDLDRDDRAMRSRDSDGGGGRPKGEGKGKRRKGDEKKEGEFGPPGCNLFVFHLPDDWTDDDLHEYFAPHGNVISAKVMKELGTGRSRGFGFVSYEDRVSSATAIKKMQGYKILGKRLKVEFKKGEDGSGKIDDGADSGRQAPDGDVDGDTQGKKSYPDDERLIGYLRAISAKNVVQSLKEGEGD